MYPRSGFWYRGTSEYTFVPFLGTGEHPNVPSFLFWYRGKSAKTTLFGNHPLRTPESDSRAPETGQSDVNFRGVSLGCSSDAHSALQNKGL